MERWTSAADGLAARSREHNTTRTFVLLYQSRGSKVLSNLVNLTLCTNFLFFFSTRLIQIFNMCICARWSCQCCCTVLYYRSNLNKVLFNDSLEDQGFSSCTFVNHQLLWHATATSLIRGKYDLLRRQLKRNAVKLQDTYCLHSLSFSLVWRGADASLGSHVSHS